MANRTRLLGLVFVVISGLPGCMVHMAEFLTERTELARADLNSNGILAFASENTTDFDVAVDFDHEQSGRTYRIDFTPSFRRVTVAIRAVKLVPVELVSDSVAMFQLPAGTFRPIRIITATRPTGMDPAHHASVRATGPTFEIALGKVSSAGRLVIRADRTFFVIKNFRIEPAPGTIDSEIRAVQDREVGRQPIVAAQIHVTTK